jgi:hypothetical protein
MFGYGRKMDCGQESELRTQSLAVWASEMSTCALRYLAQLVAIGWTKASRAPTTISVLNW